MKIIRKRELIVECERRVTIKFGRASSEKFCSACGATARFVTVDEAAIVGQTTSREIYRLVEVNRIHGADTSEGFLLVCLASLKQTAMSRNQLTAGEK